MKIALCIAGQLRDEHLTLPQAAEVARRLGAQVFISTWRRRGTKVTGIIGDSQAERMFGREFALALPERLLGGTRLVEAVPGFGEAVNAHYGEVTRAELEAHLPGAVIDIEDQDLLCLDLETDAPDVNSLRMLYKIWRCNEMKRRHEKAMGARFDLVIRMRPDLAIDIAPADAEAMLALCREGAILIPDGGRMARYLKDTIAVASSAGADQYARLFGQAVLAPHRPWRLIHNELYDHLVAGGLEPRHFPLTRSLVDRDPAAQRIKRRILLEQIGRGAVEAEAFPASTGWPAVRAILSAAHAVAEGAPLDSVLATVGAIDLDGLDGELKARACLVLALAFERDGQEAARYLSLFLAVFHRSFAREGGRKIPRAQVRHALQEMQKAALRLGFDDLLAEEAVATALSAPEVPPLLRRLHEALRAGHPSKAIEMVRGKLREALPAMLPLQRDLLAHRLKVEKDAAGARAVAAEMVRRFPSDWRALEALAQCEERLGNRREALALLQQAQALDPQNIPLAVRRGQILMETGAPAEAAELLEGIARRSGDPSAWRYCAKALMRLDRLEEARAAIGQALAKRPERADFHLLAAQIMTRSGHLAEAVEHWRAVVAQQPNHRGRLEEAEAKLAASLQGVA
ncbi:MAG TPA: tetratricopeptide repeat protein [Roseomonas sp.]|nr:tetratricopeptide repeat protein [Roseomonas sp.]